MIPIERYIARGVEFSMAMTLGQWCVLRPIEKLGCTVLAIPVDELLVGVLICPFELSHVLPIFASQVRLATYSTATDDC